MTALKTRSLEISTESKELTSEEITIVQNTWKNGIQKDIKKNGVELFIKLFTHFPDYQKKFKTFSNVPLSELRGFKRLSAHTNNVIYTLTAVVDSIEDMEIFDEMVERMTENHKRRKITLEHFYNVGLVLIDLLIENLGDEIMNKQTIDVWKKAYLILLNSMKKIFDKKEID